MNIKTRNTVQNIALASIIGALFFVLVITVMYAADVKVYSQHSPHDSYTLQAMAWRDGRIKLDRNYAHLELAVKNDTYFSTHDMDDNEAYKEYFYDSEGKWIEHDENEYYVSFPPFPSVPMLILSFIFGVETPDNLFSILYGVGALIYAILLCRKLGLSNIYSICGGMFLTVASSAFYLVTNEFPGSVWFMAQTLSMLLTSAAFYYIHGNKKSEHFAAFILLGFAVGCRPFQLLYYFYFAYVLWKKYDFKFLKTIKFYIPAAFIGIIYMLYNYVRFGSVMEFGHNYLPEFMLAENGQFSFNYVLINYKQMFLQTAEKTETGIRFSEWGFACWLSNVLFIVAVVAIIINLIAFFRNIKKKSSDNENLGFFDRLRSSTLVEKWILFILIAIHFLLILMHKSLGMLQFGSRYTVDILPATLVFIALIVNSVFKKSRKFNVTKSIFNYIAGLCLVGGTLLNVRTAYNFFKSDLSYSYQTVNRSIDIIIISLDVFLVYIAVRLFIQQKKSIIKVAKDE